MTPTHFGARVRSGRKEGEAQALDRRALYVARGNRNVVTGGSRRPCKCDDRVETAEARDAGEQHAHDSPNIGSQIRSLWPYWNSTITACSDIASPPHLRASES